MCTCSRDKAVQGGMAQQTLVHSSNVPTVLHPLDSMLPTADLLSGDPVSTGHICQQNPNLSVEQLEEAMATATKTRDSFREP